MPRTTLAAVLTVMLVLCPLALAGCTPSGDGPNEKEIHDRAKTLRKEGESAFADWRSKGEDDPEGRQAAFERAQEKLQAAADEYTKLYERHSKGDDVDPGYEYIEDAIQQINQLLHDMTKDNVLGD